MKKKLMVAMVAALALVALGLTQAAYSRSKGSCETCRAKGQAGGGFVRVVDVDAKEMLYVFDGPGSNYEKVGEIPPKATCLQLLSECGCGWLKVSYKGIVGFVDARYVDPQDPDECDSCNRGGCDKGCDQGCDHFYKIVRVRKFVNMRSGPGTDYDVVCKVEKGEGCIEYLDECGDWYKVMYDGMVGWIHSRYLEHDNGCGRRCGRCGR